MLRLQDLHLAIADGAMTCGQTEPMGPSLNVAFRVVSGIAIADITEALAGPG
ncbi:hypothetical protein KO516_20585 [Citreicella sp. C3M06]|uniref:hypothetical protein n=1 Tax=Citreicella sp. C3M06 TaxID=2841564 RepID=UPI001C091038|nr:hypothetical protein [Citreicella sp. C3M06]MBU2963175.1 hypothetical protein [Citreicella sp. C3M06]